jgi:solute carrier family 6 amino acid transporter-like protein 5/7/9/14
VLVAWIYGSNRFLGNIQEMIKLPRGLHLFWWALWTFVCPVIIAAVVILKWYSYTPMR